MVIYHKGLKDSFYNAVLLDVIFKMCKKFDFITNENEIGNWKNNWRWHIPKILKSTTRPKA